MKPSIVISPSQQKLEFSPGQSILEILLKNRVNVDHSCDGNGSCGTCRIVVKQEPLTLDPRNEIEQEMATDRNFFQNERLACQTEARDGLIIEIPRPTLSPNK